MKLATKPFCGPVLANFETQTYDVRLLCANHNPLRLDFADTRVTLSAKKQFQILLFQHRPPPPRIPKMIGAVPSSTRVY